MRNASRLKAALLSVILGLVLTAGVVLASHSPVSLGIYDVTFLHSTLNGDGTSTWSYAVTGTGSPTDNTLSHWTLGAETCEAFVSPTQDELYTTSTTHPDCGGTYTCEASTYTTVLGNDPTTGVIGVKFEDPTEPIDAGDTQIFELTVPDSAVEGPLDVGVKYGTVEVTGTVSGPVCPDVTAVTLSQSSVDELTIDLAASLAIVGALLAAGTLIAWRRSQQAFLRSRMD